MKQLTNLQKLFLVILFAFGISTVILQVPAILEQKGRAYDTTASADLQSIQSAISSKYTSTRKLPGSLNDINVSEEIKGRLSRYEYKPNQSRGSYELCATFKTDTTKVSSASSAAEDEDITASSPSSFTTRISDFAKYRKHSKGHVCFSEKVNSYYDDYYSSDDQSSATGSAFSTYSGIQSKAKDTEIQTDINNLHAKLEEYYNENNTYPSLTQLKDSNWRKTNLVGASEETYKGPNGETIGSGYNYTTTPSSCKNTAQSECTAYTLSAKLSTGIAYTKRSLN